MIFLLKKYLYKYLKIIWSTKFSHTVFKLKYLIKKNKLLKMRLLAVLFIAVCLVGSSFQLVVNSTSIKSFKTNSSVLGSEMNATGIRKPRALVYYYPWQYQRRHRIEGWFIKIDFSKSLICIHINCIVWS